MGMKREMGMGLKGVKCVPILIGIGNGNEE